MGGSQRRSVTIVYDGSGKVDCYRGVLEEIKARVSDQTGGGMYSIEGWTRLRAHIVDHFLPACEDVKLQTQLETAKQGMGEATPAYMRRFRADANRAYGTKVRPATEENRVVASFLHGLADRQFVERLYTEQAG